MATAEPSSLDPIFPLPAGTGIPPIKQGRGAELFENDVHVASGQTYRSFYVMWEQVEMRAAQNYPRYVGGPMGHVADTWLEAVVWCRNIAFPNAHIEPISERKAQKIRARETEKAKKAAALAKQKKPASEGDTSNETPTDCPKCGPHRIILKRKDRKTGKKLWKCADCGHRWSREPSKSPSKPIRKAGSTKAPAKERSTRQKSSKKRKANA